LRQRLEPWRKKGFFPALPFGSDFTQEEIVLARALRAFAASSRTWRGRLHSALDVLTKGASTPEVAKYLSRMQLLEPKTMRERLYRRVVAAAVKKELGDA